MTPAASTDEIRAAYRALAGRLHPDRQVTASDAERSLAERRMRDINESWHVLGDPARRRAYDEQRRGAARRPASRGATPPEEPGQDLASANSDLDEDQDLVDVGPPLTVTAGLVRALPWVGLLVVLGFIFVITAYAGGDDTPTPARPADAQVGDCLDVAPGPSTTVVPCAGPHEFRVLQRVSSASACPAGTEPRRLAGDMMFDCLVAGTTPN